MKTVLGILLYLSCGLFAAGIVNCCATPPPKKVKVVVKKNDTLPVGGYLALIDTPSYTNELTQRILIEFNELGSGEAVIWGGQSIFGTILDRQITIKETDTCEYEKNAEIHNCVGIAHCSVVRCDIEVKKGMKAPEYRQVLLHEYMHCMGFDDNKDPNDLMYETENVAPEINIHFYAEEAAERQRIWKNLKSLSSSIKQTK